MPSSSRCIVAAAAGAFAIACASGQHLTPTQGESYTTAFHRQEAQPKTTPRQAALGLDSQEAEIIADSYRRSLAPKESKTEEQPIIFVAPTKGTSQQPMLPPPSVPK